MKSSCIQNQNGEKISLSKIILGTVPFGTTMNKEASFAIMDLYYEHGGRTFDTARVYCDWLPGGHGTSERTLGEWVKARGLREEVVLITKGAHPPISDIHCSRVNPQEMRKDLEDSLQTMQTDYIDLYFLHRDDEKVPVSVIMDTLHEFVKEGKVRMIGASNWRIDRILEANAYAKENGKTPFAASEIQWSYAVCTPETIGDRTLICMNNEEYAKYKEAGIPVLAFTSQAYGMFSKGYKGDLSDMSDKHARFYSEENVKRYQKLLQICRETGCTPSDVALKYITENKDIDGYAVVGCSRKEQLLESMKAAE